MRKKWGPLIGGILIGLVIMAMNYKYVVNDSLLVHKNDLVYEIKKDKPFTGTSESYYEDSNKLKISSEYKKGKLHGKTIEYFENGKISKKYNYKKNILEGKYESYNEDGTLLEKHKYKDGEMVK